MNTETDLEVMQSTGILQQLTLEEKAALCSGLDFWNLRGVERLGIPSIMVADGPHGLRKQNHARNYVFSNNVPATCFPTAVTLASSWNRELLHEVGVALGEEARAEQVGVLLGPGVNIKRSPLGGRNFEYFSEDPYLSGALATAYIEGVQSTGVGTSLKHFAANNQEYRRNSIDVVVDERALREIYLASFEQPVRLARPWTVMAAYNRLNGTYCCENPRLLEQILRKEWGFDGLVISDWGAIDQRVQALSAGLDLEMPGLTETRTRQIIQAVEDGSLPLAVLDETVERILALIDTVHAGQSSGHSYDRDAHHDLARRAACEGAVLLKNDRDLLPLKNTQTIAILGAFAMRPRYQGAGSSLVTPSRMDTAYDALLARMASPNNLRYAAGYDPNTNRAIPSLIAEAQQAARDADVAVIFAGLPEIDEVEGVDRQDLSLPKSHVALIQAVRQVNDNVVVVLMNGAPIIMPWAASADAILEAYLGGQAGGTAIAQLLLGEVNPGGKLAETFPLRLEDHPMHAYSPGGPRTVEYREGIYVGYRYYDSASREVLFPFGHGLSYTTFTYTQLSLNAARILDGDDLQVTVTITNTGSRAGDEVVQLYVRDLETSEFRPLQELKGFARVALLPGQTKTVLFHLDRRAFAYYDTQISDWRIEPGQFEIRVGASSRDIRQTAVVEVCPSALTQFISPRSGQENVQAYLSPDDEFCRDTFAAIYGRPLPENLPDQPGHFTHNTPIADMRRSPVAWIFRKVMRFVAAASIQDEHDSATMRQTDSITRDMPLRMILMVGGDSISPIMVDGLITMMNGKIWRGAQMILRELRAKKSSRP